METRKRITIQEVADRAGVSISTVSRVLNETGPVVESKRQAVLDAIAELGFHPRNYAHILMKGQSLTIGVLTQALASPLFDTILRGILEELDGSSYVPLFADGNWQPEKEARALEMFLARRVDGLIVIGGNLAAERLVEISELVPTIVLGRSIPALGERCLPFDDYQAAYAATHYLVECGHRRIAHITGLLQHEDAVQRRQGYTQALCDAGIEPDPELVVEGDYTEPSGVLAVQILLTRGRSFSAIFAGNDQMALGARLGLYRRGLRVPEDISLVGFDDQAPSAYMSPPLTTVRRLALEIGRDAARAILAVIRGRSYTFADLPSRLVARESVARR